MSESNTWRMNFLLVSVIVCVTINGFSFMITQLLESLQNQTKSHRYSKVKHTHTHTHTHTSEAMFDKT